jgi:tryptophan synthase alpha chain
MKTANRLQLKIQKSKKHGEKLFCAFLTLGYPSVSATGKLIQAFERTGVDIIELGFPFSDPLADGPTIQYSSEHALAKGVRIQDAFQLVQSLRLRGLSVPILFFTYLNPIYHYGLKRFVTDARQAGFDGIIVPDLPPEEEKGFQKECQSQNLSQIFLIAPTTLKKRMRILAGRSNGFIYYVSLRGVTGARKSLPEDLRGNLKQLAGMTKKPVLIGFGVSSPDQGRILSRMCQGVIVGSAIIEKLRSSKGRLAPTVRFVGQMVRAVKGKVS